MSIQSIKDKMPKLDEIEAVSDLFKVLGDPTRSKILFVLEQGPLCVGDISECVDMTKYAVSHQLRILRQSKLVKCKRDGKEMIYSLDDDHVSSIFGCAFAHIQEDDERG